MAMPPYPIYCQNADCKNLAKYKIAARWSDGKVSELKTYCLCCEDCLAKSLPRARERYHSCRLIPGETPEEPGIYQLQRGERDQSLQRLVDLEASVLAK